MKLVINEDCANAPRKAVLRDFNAAWVRGELDAVIEGVSEDISWDRARGRPITGQADLRKALNNVSDGKVSRLIIDDILTHGAGAAVRGTVEFKSGATREFCDVYRFSGQPRRQRSWRSPPTGARDSPSYLSPTTVPASEIAVVQREQATLFGTEVFLGVAPHRLRLAIVTPTENGASGRARGRSRDVSRAR